MRLTSAPRRDFSSSVEYTPFLSGMKRFSLVTAIWIGMRQRNSASHSPARNFDTFHSIPDRKLSAKAENVVAETISDLRMFPVGFFDVLSKCEIRSWKCGANRWWSWSVMNTNVRWHLLLDDVIVSRWTAGRTGKRVHTSAWQSMRQLLAVPLTFSDIACPPRAPFSLKVNSVTFRVMSRAIERHDWASMSSVTKCTIFRLVSEVRSNGWSVGRSGISSGMPSVEPNVLQW